MRRRWIVCAFVGVAGLGLLVPPALAAHSQSHNGGGRANPWAVNVTALCGYVMTAQMDPILYPGVPAGPDNPSHMHQFFANDHISLDGTQTPASLQLDQSNRCAGPLNPDHSPHVTRRLVDGSSYWIPALYPKPPMEGMAGMSAMDDGPDPAVLVPITSHSYYRNGGVDPAVIRAFPTDLSMIGGNSHATTGQVGTVEWACASGFVGAAASQNEPPGVNVGTMIPDTCPIRNENGTLMNLRLTVVFKSCVQEDTPPPDGNYTSLLSYPVPYAARGPINASCRPGTYAIPQVLVVVRWALTKAEGLTNDGTDWDLRDMTLASDGMNGAGTHGTTAHADFMNGWRDEEFTDLIEHCFAPPYPHNCGIS